MGRVVVLGSSNTDFVLAGERLPAPGETVLGDRFFRAAGGKGANQAVAAARAGASVTLLGAVGADDLGRQALAGLDDEGIDLTHVRVVADCSSGVALILVDGQGQNLIGVGPGANARVTVDDIAALPDAAFPRSAIFVAQLEVPRPAVRAAFERAREAGMRTVFNPAPAHAEVADPGWLRLIDVLVANEHEAAELAGLERLDADLGAVERAVSKLCAAGCGAVVVTLGARGYAFGDATGVRHAPAYDVVAVDSVAAGDAFVGVLAAALSQGNSLVDAATLANKSAAIAVTRPGAQPSLPRRAEVDAFDGAERS